MLTTKRYEYLQIEKIAIHPVIGNHRQLSPAKVSHLEKDILTNGLLEPLVVWERTSGEYYLVGGFHRMAAISNIRKSHPGYFDRVDVRVVAGGPDEIRALNLKLNADRLDIRVTDYFETVIYLNNVNWSAERIAEFLDKSKGWIEEILRFAPMVDEKMREMLEKGEISWNRAKEIIQKTLKAPAGTEKDVLEKEMNQPGTRSVKPLTFKTVLGHFSKLKEKSPGHSFTLHIDDLYSFMKVLRGRDYTDEDLGRMRAVFPELIP
jgi:ParB family chromosome partitioning protein